MMGVHQMAATFTTITPISTGIRAVTPRMREIGAGCPPARAAPWDVSPSVRSKAVS